MNPYTAKIISSHESRELYAAAAAARLAREHRTGRAPASPPQHGYGSAERGRITRRQRLLARWVPARPRAA